MILSNGLKKLIIGLGLPLIMALTGCAVGPDYEPPVTQLPESFAYTKLPEFSGSGVDAKWWGLFDDNMLIGLVDQVVQHNYSLKIAEANLQEARALYLEAGLNLLPTITSHANYTEQKRSIGSLNNRSFVPRELKLFNIGFDASWEADIFGRVRRSVEVSENTAAAQEASLRDVGVSLIAETARNYFELRGLQNELEVAHKNGENLRETLAITQTKLDLGRGTELDTTRAKALLDATLAGVPALESAISQSVHRLSVLTGQVPSALNEQLLKPKPLPKLPDTIHIGNPAELLRRRADIRIVERNLAAATAQIGVAVGDLFPRVSFVGTIALEAGTFTGIGAAGSDTYSLGPRITWAAFDLGRVYARIKAAHANADANLAQYQETVLTALEETENSLVIYNRERARRDLLVSALQASERAHQLAYLRYDEGVSDFLTVLDAESRLLQNRSQLAQSQTATATALAALFKALGGGWETVLDSAEANKKG
ncbi:MAG: efflux transporter outer membrane subunit [Methylococcaceae bacterium]